MKCAMVAGVVIVVASLSGCSHSTSKPAAKVTVGGEDQPAQGDIVCAAHDGSTVITIGDRDTGVTATLTDAESPEVLSVVFGDVGGAQLMYIEDMPTSGDAADATATKDDKHYTLSGTASKLDFDPNPHSKPFEIDVTCP